MAKEDLEREIAAKTKAMRFKSSSKLLQLEDVERRLALAKAPQRVERALRPAAYGASPAGARIRAGKPRMG